MSGIVTTYFRISNDETLEESMDKCMAGFDELERKIDNGSIYADYFAQLNASTLYNYLVIILNNMGIYEISQMDSDELVDRVNIRISGHYTSGNSGEKLFIVSLYDSSKEVDLRPKVQQVQSLSNFFNINEDVESYTDHFNYSPDSKLEGDVAFVVETTQEMAFEIENLKASITDEWKDLCDTYNIDWRLYMLASSNDYMRNQKYTPATNPSTMLDLLTHYNQNDTPGSEHNVVSVALWNINEKRIRQETDIPLHVVCSTKNEQYADPYVELWTASYLVGDELDGLDNRDFENKLDGIPFFFEENGITVHALSPLDKKPFNLLTKMVKDTGGYWTDIDDFGGSYKRLLVSIASDIAGKQTILQLSKGSIIPASIRVTDRFGYEYPMTCWEYNHQHNSIIILPYQEGAPTQLTNIKVTYDYTPPII